MSKLDADVPVLQLSEFTLGRPYHAALCRLGPRQSATSFHTHQDFYELFCVLSGRGQHRLSVGTSAESDTRCAIPAPLRPRRNST